MRVRTGMVLVVAWLWAIGVCTVHAGENVWTSLGPAGGTILALAIDPDTPTTLYAGTYLGGVSKSTNGGRSWRGINTGLPYHVSVHALAIDPSTPTTLYAGTDGGVFGITFVTGAPPARPLLAGEAASRKSPR